MLGLNDTGPDVRAWQRFLIAQGFPLPQFGPDGSFGEETVQATRAFQARAGLPQSGVLDDPTEGAARALGFAPASSARSSPPEDEHGAQAGSFAAYRPDRRCLPLLGDVPTLIPQGRPVEQEFVRQPKILAVLPGGQLYFDSELQLDTDGAPELSGDATQESGTSLRYRDRQPINANRVPYFVLPQPTSWPEQFGIGLGDLAAVIFRGRIAFAVFADFGPKTKLGEGSVQLFRQLGEERVRNERVRDFGMDPGVITIVFPKSADRADLASENTLLTAINTRGPQLFQALGGTVPTA
jgi:peptidoglycan hydrolase-like protein with peptidoglycan-binding domain